MRPEITTDERLATYPSSTQYGIYSLRIQSSTTSTAGIIITLVCADSKYNKIRVNDAASTTTWHAGAI